MQLLDKRPMSKKASRSAWIGMTVQQDHFFLDNAALVVTTVAVMNDCSTRSDVHPLQCSRSLQCSRLPNRATLIGSKTLMHCRASNGLTSLPSWEDYNWARLLQQREFLCVKHSKIARPQQSLRHRALWLLDVLQQVQLAENCPHAGYLILFF